MAPTDYKTVFELGIGSFPWSDFLIPSVFIVAGFGIYKFSKLQSVQVVGLAILALSILIFAVLALAVTSNYNVLRRAYLAGISSVIEGRVENFRPMPSLGPARESFSVHGVNFSYNALDSTPCFHNGPAHLGPIRNGQFVRVHYEYDNGCIQRLEIRADGIPSTAERSDYAKTADTNLNRVLKTDPRVYRMNLGLTFVALIISLCCNFDWRHYARYFLIRGTQLSKTWEIGIRAGFFLSLVTAAAQLVWSLTERPRTTADLEAAGLFSLFGIGFFVLMDLVIRWRFRAKDRSTESTLGS
jgi:hypothetical protein